MMCEIHVHPEAFLLLSLCFCYCRRCVMASLTSPPPWPLTPCRKSWPSAPGQAAYECILRTCMWPTPPLHHRSLPPSHWRHCRVDHTSCAAFEMFLHQKMTSGSFHVGTNQLLCYSLSPGPTAHLTFIQHPFTHPASLLLQLARFSCCRLTTNPSLHPSIHPFIHSLPFSLVSPGHVRDETRGKDMRVQAR